MKIARSTSHLTAVPAWDALVTDPSLFDGLPEPVQNSLYEQIAALEARLRAKVLARSPRNEQADPSPDRAVGLDEACNLLGMEKSYLERKENWQRLGGYKDDDGHPKFALSTIQRHILQKAKR